MRNPRITGNRKGISSCRCTDRSARPCRTREKLYGIRRCASSRRTKKSRRYRSRRTGVDARKIEYGFPRSRRGAPTGYTGLLCIRKDFRPQDVSFISARCAQYSSVPAAPMEGAESGTGSNPCRRQRNRRNRSAYGAGNGCGRYRYSKRPAG